MLLEFGIALPVLNSMPGPHSGDEAHMVQSCSAGALKLLRGSHKCHKQEEGQLKSNLTQELVDTIKSYQQDKDGC